MAQSTFQLQTFVLTTYGMNNKIKWSGTKPNVGVSFTNPPWHLHSLKSQFLRDQKNPRIPFTTENAEKIRNQAGGIPYQWYSWCAKVGAIYSTLRCQKRGGKIQIWAILRNPVFRPLSSLAPPRIFYAGWSLNSKVLAMSRDIAAFDGSRFR